MCGGHGAEVGGLFHECLHLSLGFLIGLLPLGVLQSVAHARLADIGDAGAKDFILPAQFVHLRLQFSAAFRHAIEQAVGDAVLHPVELVLVGRIGQIHGAVGFPDKLLLVQLLHIPAFFLHLFQLLPLGLLGYDPCGL